MAVLPVRPVTEGMVTFFQEPKVFSSADGHWPEAALAGLRPEAARCEERGVGKVPWPGPAG